MAGGGDPFRLDEPARGLDLRLEADALRQQLGRRGHVLRRLDLGEYDDVGRASAAARRSSSHHGVERPLTRSAVVRPNGPRPRAATAIPRACSLSWAATASSRSTITSSAASDGAFASIRSLEAGTVRQERRARGGTRER